VTRTYRQAPFARVFLGQLFLACALVVTALLVGFGRSGAAGAVLALFAGIQCVVILALSTRLAREVHLRDDRIEARTYTGRKIAIPWELVGAIGEYSVPTFGASRRLRVRSADSSGSFWITELIDNYDELLNAAHKRLPNVWKVERVPLWERILLSG
jgi:hypothetical protein